MIHFLRVLTVTSLLISIETSADVSNRISSAKLAEKCHFRSAQRFLEAVEGHFDQLQAQWVFDFCEQLEAAGLNPAAILKKAPHLVGNESLNITKTLSDLSLFGFEKPTSILKRFPHCLLSSPSDVFGAHVRALAREGVQHPKSVIEHSPKVMSMDIQKELKPFFAQLRRMGFKHPGRVFDLQEKRLSLDYLRSVKAVKAELTRLGFTRPIHILQTYPTLSFLKVETNIRPTYRELREIWGLTHEQIEGHWPLLAVSLSRIQTLARMLLEYGLLPSTLPLSLRTVCLKQLRREDVLKNLKNMGSRGADDNRDLLRDQVLWTQIFSKTQCVRSLVVTSENL